MLRYLMGLLCLSWLTASASAAEIATPQEQVSAARAILDPWQETQAAEVDRKLHIVCWTPNDREFPADYRGRLSRMLGHIQEFYAHEMERHGFGRRSINLPWSQDDVLLIHEVRGLHGTSHYAKESGSEIRTECLPVLTAAGIQADSETIAIFCNLATWDAEKLVFTHNSPYYAGGSYRQGTAWQLDSSELDATHLASTSPMIRDGQYGRISLGKHNSIFIGGMAHEFGHALGLPHCAERPDEAVRGSALMGSGNRTYGDELRNEGQGSFLTLAHALRLAAHPQFSGRLETERHQPRATVSQLDLVVDGRAIVVSGKVSGEPPIYGIVAYFDPAGNSDYNATTATAVPDGDGRFVIQSNALTPGKTGELRLCLLHANGAVSQGRAIPNSYFSYSINDAGTPDLTNAQMRLALEPVVAAINAGDRAQAQRAARGVRQPEAAAIAAQLVAPEKSQTSPAEFRGSAESRGLTLFAAQSAQVGWIRPSYDRLPDASILLEAGGNIYRNGIYAHAPARHVYLLGKRWNTLAGQAGLAAGHGGTVQFEIRGDGRSLWTSPVVKADLVEAFEVDVTGIEQLELLTAPTDDGNGDDWGLWLAPVLRRAK